MTRGWGEFEATCHTRRPADPQRSWQEPDFSGQVKIIGVARIPDARCFPTIPRRDNPEVWPVTLSGKLRQIDELAVIFPAAPLHPDRPTTFVVKRRELSVRVASPLHPGVRALLRELHKDRARRRQGRNHDGFDLAEIVRAGGHFVIARRGRRMVGFGAYQPLDSDCAEIKRIYVRPSAQRRGVGRLILRQLEDEVRRCGFVTIALEATCGRSVTPEEYESAGYMPIPAYLDHVGQPESRCYAKRVGRLDWATELPAFVPDGDKGAADVRLRQRRKRPGRVTVGVVGARLGVRRGPRQSRD